MIVKVIAYTPVGTFASNAESVTPKAAEELSKSLEKANKFTNLTLKNGDRSVYLPSEVIKQTVFVVEITQEEGDA
jgi:hypothetical protein